MANDGQPCGRNGCGGTIVDGFCDECGKPAVAGAVAAAVGTPAAAAATVAARGTVATGRGTGTLGTGRGSGTLGTGKGSSRTGKSSSRGSRGSSSRRNALGGGLVSLPPAPSMDPLTLILADPTVPENKRFCSKECTETGADGKEHLIRFSRDHGFCRKCGTAYDFRAALKAGDVVAGQYEIKGAMAYGGLGWIYLGWDQKLSRWCVLKGLLNSADPVAAAAAVAERQFLAAVKHPRIVGVHNFVQHGNDGYIVMEYVGGRTIKSMLKERGVLPPEEAVSYIHAILPAFGYLHRNGMVYCDFKPDNFMLEEDDVKLIDMGGVRRIDDPDGDVYGTKGYAAPEAANEPSIESDLYTLGRSLAVLIMKFPFQGANEFSLPTPTDQPVLAQHPGLYRFLQRACSRDPAGRFQSAEDMADQLIGVLRSIVATDADPKPADSVCFIGQPACDAGAEKSFTHEEAPWAAPARPAELLPALRTDPEDPGAQIVLSLASTAPAQRIDALSKALTRKDTVNSTELKLRLADAQIAAGDVASATKVLDAIDAEDAWEWRSWWMRGRLHLSQGKASDARACFERVWNEVPGELAPRLAIGLSLEAEGRFEDARTHLRDVLRVDPNWTGAAFALARCEAALGKAEDVLKAYGRVPQTSIVLGRARMSLARALTASAIDPKSVGLLADAASALSSQPAEGLTWHFLAAELFAGALAAAERVKAAGFDVLGVPMEPRALREAAERELRACAKNARSEAERWAFVDAANSVRPATLV